MRRDGRLLFTKPDHPFARAQRLRADNTQELVPIRVLVVEGTRDEKLGTRDEIDGIRAAVPAFTGRIDVTVLTEPSAPVLRAESSGCGRTSCISPGTASSPPAPRSPPCASATGCSSATTSTPCCRSCRASRSSTRCRTNEGDVSQVRALAQAFLANGSAAVIGMQGDVRGQAAAQFGRSLYAALAKGRLIDGAVAAARADVYTLTGSQQQARDWFLPSLTLRVRAEQVLPIRCFADLTEDDLELIERDLYPGIRFFVDRAHERWESWPPPTPTGGTSAPADAGGRRPGRRQDGAHEVDPDAQRAAPAAGAVCRLRRRRHRRLRAGADDDPRHARGPTGARRLLQERVRALQLRPRAPGRRPDPA